MRTEWQWTLPTDRAVLVMAELSTAEYNATPDAIEGLTQQLAESAEPKETEVDEPEDITNLTEKPDDQVLADSGMRLADAYLRSPESSLLAASCIRMRHAGPLRRNTGFKPWDGPAAAARGLHLLHPPPALSGCRLSIRHREMIVSTPSRATASTLLSLLFLRLSSRQEPHPS